jgi:hypothetical protein
VKVARQARQPLERLSSFRLQQVASFLHLSIVALCINSDRVDRRTELGAAGAGDAAPTDSCLLLPRALWPPALLAAPGADYANQIAAEANQLLRDVQAEQNHQQAKPGVKLTIGDPPAQGWIPVELWRPVAFDWPRSPCQRRRVRAAVHVRCSREFPSGLLLLPRPARGSQPARSVGPLTSLELLWQWVPESDHPRVMLPTVAGLTQEDNNYADNPFLLRLNQLGYKAPFGPTGLNASSSCNQPPRPSRRPHQSARRAAIVL